MVITPKTRLLWCKIHHPRYAFYYIIYMVIVMGGKNSLGMRLQCLRQRKGLSQAELASMVIVSRETVKDWENDRYEPSCEILVKLSNLYQISTDSILGVKTPRMISTDQLTNDQIEYITQLVHSMKKNN